MITADGWFDGAVRVPGSITRTNTGQRNDLRGIFLHSAEGYKGYLYSNPPLARVPDGSLDKSWHLSNLLDGTLLQHYSIFDVVWHATAANPHYLGFEHEGKVPNEPSLTDAQIATDQRVIAEIAALKGWIPRRTGDISQTLWEHREVIWLGGTGSSCPNGRIPWARILGGLNVKDGWIKEGFFWTLYNNDTPVRTIGSTDGQHNGREAWNFGGQWWWVRHFDGNGNFDVIGKLSTTEGD